MSLLRTRWAAIGAAVAVTLGGGGLVFVDAAQDSGERSVYTPIEPCRLVDTRPNKGIGGRTAPIGPNETIVIGTHGASGECTGTPTDITAVQLNITPVLPTEPTDLTIWPSGSAPNASSLNPAPGQPPTPNAVTSEVTNSGEFRIRNKFGNVHVIVDMAGYYRHHTHDDRYYNEDEIDDIVEDLKYISLDPAAFHTMGTAKFYDNQGLHLSDGTARVSFGFTLPPDHTPGGDFDVTLLWRAADTDCTADEFDLNFIYANRYGQPPFGIFMYRIVSVVLQPHQPHNLQRLAWRTEAQNNMQPGDAVLITVERTVQAGCSGDVIIGGAFATYD